MEDIMKTGINKYSKRFIVGTLWVVGFMSTTASVHAQVDVLRNYTDPTLYASSSAWEAAVLGADTVQIPDIGDLYPNYGFSYGTPPASVTYDGVTFSTDPNLGSGGRLNLGTGWVGSGLPPVLSVGESGFYAEEILITFPSPVTGFGVQYGDFQGGGMMFTLSTADLIYQGTSPTFNPSDLSAAYSTPDFLGVTDSTPITSVLVETSYTDILNISSVSYEPAAIPDDASTLILLGIPFFLFVLLKKW